MKVPFSSWEKGPSKSDFANWSAVMDVPCLYTTVFLNGFIWSSGFAIILCLFCILSIMVALRSIKLTGSFTSWCVVLESLRSETDGKVTLLSFYVELAMGTGYLFSSNSNWIWLLKSFTDGRSWKSEYRFGYSCRALSRRRPWDISSGSWAEMGYKLLIWERNAIDFLFWFIYWLVIYFTIASSAVTE